MWGDENGYDAGVFAAVGGGLEVLTEAAAGVPSIFSRIFSNIPTPQSFTSLTAALAALCF